MQRDEYVTRLEIAVNDRLLMSVLDGPANIGKQLQPAMGAQFFAVTVIGDWNAADQLHDEKGATAFGSAGVEHPSYVWMIHHRQGLLLCLEAGNHLTRIHPR